MIEEIKTDNNCIVRAFENNPISILHEDINNKRVYYFKASDVGKVLGIVNIRTSIVNFDDDEKVVRTTYSLNSGNPDTLFLTSQGVYRLLYNSKKDVAKKFRKWAGNILDDIIFNESKQLKEQLREKDEMIKLLENKPETEGFARTNGYIYIVRDKSKPGHYKIGLAEDPNKRLVGLNCGSSTNSIEIVKTYQSKDTTLSEKVIHSVLYPYKIKKQKEWFYIHNDDLLNIVLDTIKDCVQFTDKYTFDSMEEHLQYVTKNINIINTNIKNHIKFVTKEVQTDIESVNRPQLQAEDDDEIVFDRFLNESCVFGDLVYCSKRDLIYQYKIWSKINNIFNHKNFEQYLLTKFRSKKMLNKIFNCEMCCILGINLKDSFYNFNFKESHNNFEKFIIDCCVKLPTGKLNRTTIKDKYETWCRVRNLEVPNKHKIVDLCKFLDKYFFKDKFYQGETTYLGWYGITIKEDVLKGTGITSTLCKKNKVCKVYKDEPNIIVKEWDSQKTTAEELGIHKSTLKSRIDNKFIFIDGDREFYLIRQQDLVKNNLR
jgi:prophage antirepressor-like protein